MQPMLSKSQIDKIGEQLRKGTATPDTLKALAVYQAEFDTPYKYIENILTKKMYLEITGRPAKSTLSIIEKLRRIKSRLSQIQDISGCRTIVHNISEQDDTIARAKFWFPDMVVDDKRDNPTNGYRAAHLIVRNSGKIIEVQVRTRIQHLWSTISEKISDIFGQELKYGKGDSLILSLLNELSEASLKFDLAANELHRHQYAVIAAKRRATSRAEFTALKKGLRRAESETTEKMYAFRSIIMKLEEIEVPNVLSD